MKGYHVMKRDFIARALTVCGILLLAGCCSHSSEKAGYLSDEPIKDVRISPDGYLPGGMAVVDIATNINKIDVYSVQIVALSPESSWFESDDPEVYNYRFRWFDGQGFEVEPASAVWHEKIVYPGERAVFTGVAPSPAAADFLFDIREK